MSWGKRNEEMKAVEFCIWIGVLLCCAVAAATVYQFREKTDSAQINISNLKGACKHAALEVLK